MLWTKTVDETEFLDRLFPDSAPSLSRVTIHELRLHRDGPSVLIRFDLAEYPSDPPKKWVAGAFNTVQITLWAFEIKEWEMAGWSTNTAASMKITTIVDDVAIVIGSAGFEARLVAGHVRVDRVTAYCDVSGC